MPARDLEMSRREALGLAAAMPLAAVSLGLALGQPAAAAAQAAFGLDAFIALSARLTGADADDLDGETGARILAVLQAEGHGPALARLAAAPGSPAGPLANAIVAAWYSGIAGEGPAARLASYTGALLWAALDFTKPGGECGGETGYWAAPPDA